MLDHSRETIRSQMRRRSCTSTQSIESIELGSWFCSSSSMVSFGLRPGQNVKRTDQAEDLERKEGQRGGLANASCTHLSEVKSRGEREGS